MPQGFAHVVDGEGGDAGSSEGLHFNPGFATHFDLTFYCETCRCGIRSDVDLWHRRVAKCGKAESDHWFFGSLNSCDDCGLENGAFLYLKVVGL